MSAVEFILFLSIFRQCISVTVVRTYPLVTGDRMTTGILSACAFLISSLGSLSEGGLHAAKFETF